MEPYEPYADIRNCTKVEMYTLQNCHSQTNITNTIEIPEFSDSENEKLTAELNIENIINRTLVCCHKYSI